MKPILLFDIDGTLLHIKKDFLKNLLLQIFSELDLKNTSLLNQEFAGRTDKDIFNSLVSGPYASPGLFMKMKALYLEAMQTHLSSSEIIIIEEAREAVLYAAEKEIEIGLCTGNFREAAKIKLKAARLEKLFDFGGFGCHHNDRKFIPGEAHHDYVKKRETSPLPWQYVVIGDTPNDIRCAKYFGARSVAVSTGRFSNSLLRSCKPNLLLDDLKKTRKFGWPGFSVYPTASQT